MKRWMSLALAAALALFVAACGGGDNHSHNGNQPGGHDHDHDDDHSKMEKHALGKLSLDGGITAEVIQLGDPVPGKEMIFEIKLTKDGAVVKDAQVTAWLGDEAGKELAAVGKGEWMADENLFDAHVECPKELPASAKIWVRVRQGGADAKGSLAIERH